jgi:hypothetical protein
MISRWPLTTAFAIKPQDRTAIHKPALDAPQLPVNSGGLVLCSPAAGSRLFVRVPVLAGPPRSEPGRYPHPRRQWRL